ncbi:DNA-directed RNA polymerase subunit delta [Halalkalibacter oceani]|uniref:Probable DNA-directed RNA polymerase subunit delta n=1 Tax=Halalkalibacter oceani TaxID=1653776 RepID=A0A9X2DNL9_9BACI|nr:DNA-directed RNA polymerase subunit delta [Halalkalibacter oceani]MCM3714234.1 DNA-directed RNA polymerase subunit delta [Halalkalibacter oceani]
MNFDAMTKEEIQEVPMVEIAYAIMKEERNPFDYYDLMKKVAELKGMTDEEVEARIANLYTDMNIDGRFHSLGDNRWGLKSWYPLEQAEEEITTPVKPRRKAKAVDDEDIDLDEDFDEYEDEYEDLEDELDEISNEEDADEEEDFDDKEIEELEDDVEESDDEDFEEEEEID